MPIFASFVCGLVFGCGLTVSGMIQPAKVLGFLDVFGIPSGSWDPSLAVVMAAGLTVASIGYALVRRRPPLFEKKSLWLTQLLAAQGGSKTRLRKFLGFLRVFEF